MTQENREKAKTILNEYIEILNENRNHECYNDCAEDFDGLGLSPMILHDMLINLGYEQVDSDENGWELDFWWYYHHKDENFPPLCISACGTDFTMSLIPWVRD